MPSVNEEVRYRLLKLVESHPEATQRELARALGISLGKLNYCLRAVVAKGWVKVRNFSNSRNKAAYAYILTPKGVEEKVNVTAAFLRRKVSEYDALKAEIESLSRELNELKKTAATPSR